MTNEDFDLVCGFADDVVRSGMWPTASFEQTASLRLTAIRVAFVALGVSV